MDETLSDWGNFLTFNALNGVQGDDSDHDYNGVDGRLVMHFDPLCIQDIMVRHVMLEFVEIGGNDGSCIDNSCPDLGDLNDDGSFLQIRFNNRHDFVFYDTHEKLTEFYRAKRKFHKMINSKDYMIQFRLPPGGLLIADNYRVLHGRTSFKTSKGNRFLQGLYIDHDSMESKYKIMKAKNSE